MATQLLGSEYRLDPDRGEIFFSDEIARRPWKKVALAVGLLLFGTVLLCTGIGLYFSKNEQSHAAGLPLIVVGSFAFIPGAYHVRIAYLAWRGYHGYSLNLIPDF